MTEPTPTPAPVLRVVRGTPDDTELAALVAVLAARGSGGPEQPAPARSVWADPAWRVRGRSTHGPGAWRVSALPR